MKSEEKLGPGSFTKNMALKVNHGLSSLRQAIVNGFGDQQRVSRKEWRARNGIFDHENSLVPMNFFLANEGDDLVEDQLVRCAKTDQIADEFDYLALFTFRPSAV